MTNAEENEMMNCECIAIALEQVIAEEGLSMEREDHATLKGLHHKYNERFAVLHAQWVKEKQDK